MKIICSILLLFSGNQMLQAQDTTGKMIYYDWESKDNTLRAQISLKPSTDFVGIKTALYYLALADSAQEKYTDSNYMAICRAVPPSTIVFNIQLLVNNDSLSNPIFLELSKLVVGQLIPDIVKKFPMCSGRNVILAGTNESAVIALSAACLSPDKFNKTALFFNGYAPGFALSNQFDSLAVKIKGKLYLQITNNENQFNSIDYLANVLALKSSIMLFKIDADDNNAFEMDFKEGYNWLMANGNNFIIDTRF